MDMDTRMNATNILYPSNAGDFLVLQANLSGPQSGGIRMLRIAAPLAGDLGGINAGKYSTELNCCPEKKKYAVIMVGSNDSMFEWDGSRMYDQLLSEGYRPQDIYYLDALGTMPGNDGKTTIAGFKAALDAVISKAECCDEVFIFLAGHGSQAPVWQYRNRHTGEIKWVRSVADLGPAPADWVATGRKYHNHRIQVNPYAPGGGRMRSDELSPYVGKMKSCYIRVLYASCYSGAAVTDLSMPGTIVMTPVDGEHVSYGQNAWSPSWHIGTYFAQAYVQAKSTNKTNADSNGDGQVSEKEAFDYADRRNSGTMEAKRAYYLNCFNTNPDPAIKQYCLKKAMEIAPQVGQYSDGGPCDCCYIDCNETSDWKCSVFAGRNKPNCDECAGKKIGELCRAVTRDPAAR